MVVQQRSLGVPVSGPILCAKPVQLHDKLHKGEIGPVPTFQASKGWLWRFCNCHGMRQLTVQREKLSSDTTAPEPFKEKLQMLMDEESLTLQQVYNCDETGLYYRMLPNKTIAARSEKQAPGFKRLKDRVTIMTCSNVSGSHKLPLMFVGKAANPCCFKNVNKAALPCGVLR